MPGRPSDIGKADQGSRGKAEKAAQRTNQQNPVSSIPFNANGKPMIEATMTASELLPTGQYANVSVGPCQLRTLIDPDRTIEYDEEGEPLPYFAKEERDVMIKALHEMAEIIEADVIAVQRNLVLENLQEESSG